MRIRLLEALFLCSLKDKRQDAYQNAECCIDLSVASRSTEGIQMIHQTTSTLAHAGLFEFVVGLISREQLSRVISRRNAVEKQKWRESIRGVR